MKVLVTGGSGDIGEAIVRTLVCQGAQVCFQYHSSQKRAQSIAQDLEITALKADLGKPKQATQLVKKAAQLMKGLDAVVNVAGFPINDKTRPYWDLPFEKISPQMFQDVWAVDLMGTVSVIQAALPYLKKSQKGKIINFTSASAHLGHEQGYPFNLAKAGVINLTKSLAKELGPSGITVNAIAPCTIKTHWLSSYPKSFENNLKKKIPLGRLGTPEDISRLVSFLISPGGNWLTGQVYVMDGGETL